MSGSSSSPLAGTDAASPARWPDASSIERPVLDNAPLSRSQVIVVVLTVLLAAVDGYDALSMAFVAPALGAKWALGKAAIGVLLSSGLLGMAGGSIGLSPFADIVGRRPMMLGGLVLMTVGALLSALCRDVPELLVCRILTGLGIGVMVALTTSIASEFVGQRNRPVAVAATTVGFSIGGVAGGVTAALVLRSHSWTWIFLVGSIASVLLLLLVLARMPESPAFIIARRAPNALERLNQVLVRLGHPRVAMLPPAPARRRTSYAALFTSELAGVTLRYAVVYGLIAATAYYMLSWLPQMVTDAGFRPSTAGLVSAIGGLIGVLGAFASGTLARFISPAKVAAGAMIGLAGSLVYFGFVPASLPALVLAASAFSFFLSGSTAVLFATTTAAFPPLTRVSGVGFVMGVGRILSASGPTIAGWMFASGLTRSDVSLVFAACSVLGGVMMLPSSFRRHQV